MVGYSKQLEICEFIRNRIKHSIAVDFDWKTQMRADIPSTENILRAFSTFLKTFSEEQVREFVTEYILRDLQLTDVQKDQLRLG